MSGLAFVPGEDFDPDDEDSVASVKAAMDKYPSVCDHGTPLTDHCEDCVGPENA